SRRSTGASTARWRRGSTWRRTCSSTCSAPRTPASAPHRSWSTAPARPLSRAGERAVDGPSFGSASSGPLPPPPTAAGFFRPGDQAYWSASVPPTTYARPLSGLATALTILLSVMGLLSLAAAGTRVNRAAALQDFVEGSGSVSAVLSAENTLGLVAFISTIGVLATGI